MGTLLRQVVLSVRNTIKGEASAAYGGYDIRE